MGSGTLKLVMAEDVNSMVFADNSSSDWGTGNLAITGASDNEVFGTNASGITLAQLSKITLSGSSVDINSEGKLSIAGSNNGNVVSESTLQTVGGIIFGRMYPIGQQVFLISQLPKLLLRPQ